MSPRKRRPSTTAFKHILVDVDSLADDRPALDQAVDLAARSGAKVTVVDVTEEVPQTARAYVSDRFVQDLVERRAEALDEAVARVKRRKSKVRIKTDVLRGRPATAIVQFVLKEKVDLVVRSHARDVSAKRPGFGSVDMQLLRKCPCPVWVVGVGERSRPKRILAAIHPDRDDPVEQALNHRIVEAARLIADLEKGAFTVLTAWSAYGESVLRSRMSPAELRMFVKAARASARAAFDDLLAEIGPLGRRGTVTMVKGQASKAIPSYARRHDIDLVVMGTVARGGLAGLLMGNTAEQMLNQLRCSVFALKPEGFKSPIEA